MRERKIEKYLIKKPKQMLIVIALFTLLIFVGGTTIAFFNYTRTGGANTVKVGRINFLSEQNGNITLTNVFPITITEALTDTTNAKSMTITVTGDTDYNEGIEYLITASEVNNTVNGKTIPITIEVTVNGNGLGTEETGDYYTDRDSYSTSKYKVEYKKLKEDGHILVGYIAPNTTPGVVSGINGSITIKAYVDKDNILITDTLENGPIEVNGYTNGTQNHDEKTIISTEEWNSITGDNALSFKIKVEANEGIWVEGPLPALETIKKNVITNTLINFANPSSDSNGQGLYILPGTESDTHPIYYYRGDIDNNNVVFGGFCWQMVRTTETGGIKMIYNGLPDVSGSGDNITYNCGKTRDIQNTIMTTTSLSQSTGYYYADDYEIVSTSGHIVTYRLKQGTNPITQVAIADATAAATAIPTIATNYPYTCKKTTDSETCTSLYKVDSYASETNANVYRSSDGKIIGRSEFNTSGGSLSDVGYMSNTRYPIDDTSTSIFSIFGKDIEWHTDHYLVIENSANTASTNTTKDSTHHYSCGTATSTVGNSECTSVRYYFYNRANHYWYITLSNGDTIEDALYKMTGNGTPATKSRNSGYELNLNNSTAKTAIDNWFRTNLSNEINTSNPDYSAYLEDTVYCNDRSFKTIGNTNTYTRSGWNPNGGNMSTPLAFGTLNRYKNSWYSKSNVPAVKNTGEVPNIACPNEIDRFTVSNTNGNGALTYPVGLLTADEIILAGVNGTGNNFFSSHYLVNGQYWTMSPVNLSGDGSFTFNTYSEVLNSNNVSTAFDLRPVVSLRLGIKFESDGDGTGTNPYVVIYN